MEYRFEDVLKRIYADAGDPDLDDIEAKAAEARREADSAKAVATSILSVYLSQRDDAYLANLRDDIQKSEALTVRQAIAVQLPRGTIMSRDSRALTGGVGPAPHQQVLAAVTSIKSAFDTCSGLARLLDRAGDHIERASALGFSTRSRQGGSVFIGHGHSPLWRELKDFIHERLKLPWDEFNRVPVAGRRTSNDSFRCWIMLVSRSSSSRLRTSASTAQCWLGRMLSMKWDCFKVGWASQEQ